MREVVPAPPPHAEAVHRFIDQRLEVHRGLLVGVVELEDVDEILQVRRVLQLGHTRRQHQEEQGDQALAFAAENVVCSAAVLLELDEQLGLDEAPVDDELPALAHTTPHQFVLLLQFLEVVLVDACLLATVTSVPKRRAVVELRLREQVRLVLRVRNASVAAVDRGVPWPAEPAHRAPRRTEDGRSAPRQ